MKSYHIAVVLADAARARIFTIADRPQQAGQPGPSLVEHVDLVNPSRRQRASEQMSDTRPGSRRAPGTGHAVDDRRDANIDESDRKFAADIVDAAKGVADQNESSRMVIVAPPGMLGVLRKRTDAALKGPTLEFIDKDLTKLTPSQALEHLIEHANLAL